MGFEARWRRFAQVDVFGRSAGSGNPVAVVLDAEGLDEQRMQAFARWTNLSETTFVLPPTDASADYRVRIFTPAAELPFAGHPTLGTAHAWLGDRPMPAAGLVQECAAGLVPLRGEAGRLAFASPPLIRSGPVDEADLTAAAGALRLAPEDLLGARWVDNGPGWLGVRLADADTVLALRPDFPAMAAAGLKLGVVGPHPSDGPADFEVRAFVPRLGILEDPVTGSLNAGLAGWLLEEGLAAASYTVRQGTAVGRDGRVQVTRDADGTWTGGATHTLIRGEVEL